VARVRIVDNGSTDATATIARNAGAELVSEPKRGYGPAAWRGLLNIPPDIRWGFFSSADGSDRLNPATSAAFRNADDAGADLVLSERPSLPDSLRQLTAAQRFGNWLCCRLLALCWGCQFRDMASLRIIRREALSRLDLQDRGFGWNVEMQVRATEERLRMVEVPVLYHPRLAGVPKISGSLLGVLRAGRGMTCIILRLYCQRHLRLQSHLEPQMRSSSRS